jgi:hypothetical protein
MMLPFQATTLLGYQQQQLHRGGFSVNCHKHHSFSLLLKLGHFCFKYAYINSVSNVPPFLIKIPFSAPFPTPTIIAVGVASPKAQGQATINTAMNTVNKNM